MRQAFLALGLTANEFARLTGVQPATVSRWGKAGARTVPAWAELLLVAWETYPDALNRARQPLAIQPSVVMEMC